MHGRRWRRFVRHRPDAFLRRPKNFQRATVFTAKCVSENKHGAAYFGGLVNEISIKVTSGLQAARHGSKAAPRDTIPAAVPCRMRYIAPRRA